MGWKGANISLGDSNRTKAANGLGEVMEPKGLNSSLDDSYRPEMPRGFGEVVRQNDVTRRLGASWDRHKH